jgi:hypothetical protein
MTSHPPSPSVLEDGDVPVELVPDDPSTLPMWLAMLGGPLLWGLHFLVVYLVAEWSCAPVSGDGTRALSADGLVAVIVGATAVAAVGIVASGLWAWRRWRSLEGHHATLGLIGLLLAIGSLYAVLAVGLPALVLEPC